MSDMQTSRTIRVCLPQASLLKVKHYHLNSIYQDLEKNLNNVGLAIVRGLLLSEVMGGAEGKPELADWLRFQNPP